MVGCSLLLIASCLAACSASPEASRTRDGGPGADMGNRGANVQLHASTSQPYYGTPNLNPRIAGSASK